jgi:hypothetical protein
MEMEITCVNAVEKAGASNKTSPYSSSPDSCPHLPKSTPLHNDHLVDINAEFYQRIQGETKGRMAAPTTELRKFTREEVEKVC